MWALAGCTTSSSPAFKLYTHCGIYELSHDGKWYVRNGGALTDGNGNPPAGWDNPMQSGSLTIRGATATFTDDAGHRETFSERPGATAPLNICA